MADVSLTAEEAKEFHAQFKLGTFTFGGVALVAHILVWAWKPWFAAKTAALTIAATSLLG